MTALPLPADLALAEPPAWHYQVEQWAADVAALAADAGMAPAELVAAHLEAVAQNPDADAGPIDRWTVTHDGEAEWALRHVAEADAALEELRLRSQDWQARIEHWFQQATGPLLARRAFFAAHLERYALAQREANPSAKSLVLPSGRVKTIQHSAAAHVADEAALIPWALAEVPDAVKVTHKVLISQLREHVDLVQVPVEAVLSCGCVTRLAWEEDATRAMANGWQLGSGVICPECRSDALVGRWNQAITLVFHGQAQPPGLGVSPARLSASVVAEQP